MIQLRTHQRVRWLCGDGTVWRIEGSAAMIVWDLPEVPVMWLEQPWRGIEVLS
jgi:hypothetical protein